MTGWRATVCRTGEALFAAAIGPPQPPATARRAAQPQAVPAAPWLCPHVTPAPPPPFVPAGALPKRLLTGPRLVGGPSRREGRLEVRVAGKWGSVCNRNVSDTATAHVVCRSLGFEGAAGARGGAFYGEGTLAPVLEVLRCDGDEPGLHRVEMHRADAGHAAWLQHAAIGRPPGDCNSSADFGVWCRGESKRGERSTAAPVRPPARQPSPPARRSASPPARPPAPCVRRAWPAHPRAHLVAHPRAHLAPAQAAKSLPSTACVLPAA